MPLWKWEKIQKMLRSLRNRLWVVGCGLWGLAAVPLQGAIWPDQIGEFAKAGSKPVAVTNRPLWDEYGLDLTEQAEYASGARKFLATAFRLKDSTGAFAAFQWQRPAQARPSKLAELAVETADGALVAYGNYLLRFDGWMPPVVDLAALLDRLPKIEKSPLPTLAGYLPSPQLVTNSERYVLGPVSLDQFDPGIPPSIAAFHMGAEAQLGRFRAGDREMTLAVFSYPTPHIARDQFAAFQKLPGAMAKRSGPLVAVILSPQDPDAAERLLALVRYEASVTLAERMPTRRDNVGDLILNILELTGILLVFCTLAGVAYGGFRTLSRRWRGGPGGEDPMIMLHLSDR